MRATPDRFDQYLNIQSRFFLQFHASDWRLMFVNRGELEVL